MQDAHGARAVRLAMKEPQLEARVAQVAIQLGMLEDAEKLYRQCGRYDLLVNMLRASGRWKRALQVCERHDRIHLKTTQYLYGKHLESTGNVKGAISMYEASGTHEKEVPRMYFDLQQLDELEEYIRNAESKALTSWWAQYCESVGRLEEALQGYHDASDTLSLVRVLCSRGEFQTAAQLCLDTNDSAACYHMARQCEGENNVQQAIQFYSKAGRHHHAMRIARENGMDNDLMALALESNDARKVEAARYFEERQIWDKAVLLYQKGGRAQRAVELCFRSGNYDALRQIADDLGPQTDPALLVRCAEFFMQHRQFDKAVTMYIDAKRHDMALDLCVQHNVHITAKMADALTPAKSSDPAAKKRRVAVLLDIAKCCRDQRSYHLACKKYTQAGDKVRAMKCLIRSQDTEKIIYYANMAGRKKELFILAANYLQTLVWHKDANIMKTIIGFYTKARALEQLSSFYEACARVEIDEYRDYSKAVGAMKEALKYLIKAKDVDNREQKMAALDRRLKLAQRYVHALELQQSNPSEMMAVCHELLDEPQDPVQPAIRLGDVYALLINQYFTQGDMANAYNMLQQMQQQNIAWGPYIDNDMYEQVHRALGVDPTPADDGAGDDGVDGDGAFNEEEIGGDEQFDEDVADDDLQYGGGGGDDDDDYNPYYAAD
eukprot:TRINITY_DN56570_c0_g3_i1.p1 TRINITY_DN56570_c0_g3~~TRINITY_DN56570_c0_g3_i1.p1  ORF type:complete len:722 (+),score=428.01 TRINITY_DN56570_c0_g3_i1:176-2167(+)